jgi:hypothetical protein
VAHRGLAQVQAPAGQHEIAVFEHRVEDLQQVEIHPPDAHDATFAN